MATYDKQFGPRRVSSNRPTVPSMSVDQDDAYTASDTIPTHDVVPLVEPVIIVNGGSSNLAALAAWCRCGGRNNNARAYVSLAVLSSINLLNYMDRYTVAGVLIKVQHFYNIDNSAAGFIQSSFVISYMIFSMLFGYLGDRFNRKVIMGFGILFWSAITLASSFIGSQYFAWFIITRALVGIGEASYSTIAPTVLADLFIKEARTRALAVFYFAIPVGSGLGYIVGSKVAEVMQSWQWALRITPCFGVVCAILILTVVYEPARGEAEGGNDLVSTSWFSDVKYLLCNKSFMLSTLGFTCVTFVTGALALWAPTFVSKAAAIQKLPDSDAELSLYFGIITCVAGLVGVTVGTQVASMLRRITNDADPLVCAIGLLAGTPFLFCALVVSRINLNVTWVCIFIGETLLFFNWALITDILMYVVIPTRRSTAEAVQILTSHTLGDASSPYLIGVISDRLGSMAGVSDFASLQYALYITCFVSAIGGAFFLVTTFFVHRDRLAADRIVAQSLYAQSDPDQVDHQAIRDDRDALSI